MRKRAASASAAPQHGGASSDAETLYALDVFSAAVTEKIRQLDRENIALRAKSTRSLPSSLATRASPAT
jgi:hypothetical protein